MRTISENASYVWCELQTDLFLSRSIIKAQEEALTQNSGDFTSLFVYPILIGSLLFNLAIGGKLLESGELLDLPNLSPLIDMAIDQLEQPLEQQDLGDISKIDRFQSKIDQDFSDFDFIDTSPPKQKKVTKGNPVLEGGGDEEVRLGHVPGEAVDRAGVVAEEVDTMGGTLPVLTVPQANVAPLVAGSSHQPLMTRVKCSRVNLLIHNFGHLI